MTRIFFTALPSPRLNFRNLLPIRLMVILWSHEVRLTTWKCLGCGRLVKSRDIPILCECGVYDSWCRDTPTSESIRPQAVSCAFVPNEPIARRSTGFPEFDRLLGGGFGHGTTALVYGAPGAGKSRITYAIGSRRRCLLVSLEQDVRIVREILLDVGQPRNVYVLEDELWHAEANRLRVKRVVVDSLSACRVDAVNVARRAQKWAQRHDAIVLLIQQVTKADTFRGSRELAHWCDYEIEVCPAPHGTAVVRVRKSRISPTGSVRVPITKKQRPQQVG